jgi:hypothetical protein
MLKYGEAVEKGSMAVIDNQSENGCCWFEWSALLCEGLNGIDVG